MDLVYVVKLSDFKTVLVPSSHNSSQPASNLFVDEYL